MITQISKSTSEKYRLRFDSFECMWADIIIDDDGSFNVQSDNGNFCHSWPRHGRKSFKHFLIEISRDPDYLLRKVSRKTELNEEKTLKNWFSSLAERRREGEISKEDAREIWDELTGLLSDFSDPTYIETSAYQGPLSRFKEPWDSFSIVKEYPSGARHFAEKIMPQFAEILLSEVE